MRRLKNGSTTQNLGQDGLDRCRPDERPGVGVVERDIGVDRGHEVRHVPEDAPPDALGGQLAEPALDQVEPGRAGRGEVEMEARVSPGFRSWISREYLWARIRGVGPGDAQAEAVTAGVGSSA